MKNTTAIINSDLNRDERLAAELIREEVNSLGFKKAIKKLRTQLDIFNITEKDLRVGCVFHNLLNEYANSY